MNDDNDKQQFVEGLYSDMENQLNDVYEQKKESRDELLKVIGEILLAYTILNNVISLSKSEYNKEYILLSKLIKKHTEDDIGQTNSIVDNITKKTIDKTFNFYSYNHNFKDVEKIVNENFRGKHFSERVWVNEKEVAKKLNKQCQDFLKGKINVNQIKKTIEKTYNTSAYNAKRLVETEVARCHSAAFDRFGQEVGVKKVRYNSILDRKTCDDCKQYDEKIYNFDKKPELPRHPMCRCYYDIVDDNYENNVSNSGKSDIMEERNVSQRNMTNGNRKSAKVKLSDNDKKHLLREIEAINADQSVFEFRDGYGSGYSDSRDIIYISSNILPSNDNSLHPRDLMSERAALAHEYYGHRANRGTDLEKGSWNDEFRASYMAAKNCPNLSDYDRMYLILDAIERAKEAGVSIKYNDFMRGVLYGH